MKYIVTGGAGFIGSNLVERLLSEGHDVTVIDDLSTGSLDNVPQGVPIIQESYELALPRLKVDRIFHLGAPSNSLMYRENHGLVGRIVSEFTYILEYARKHAIRLVYVSSSSIYNGNPTPWSEGMPIKPKDFYTEGRYAWERLARLYYEFHGVESIGLRLFSVYGPHEEAKGIYANLLSQLMWAKERGETFDVYGDKQHGFGNQRRDTIHVFDVVDALLLAMNSDIECDIFNIGTGKTYSLNEMATMLGTKTRHVENPINPNYVWVTHADTTKAEKLLGFKAKYSLEGGLAILSTI